MQEVTLANLTKGALLEQFDIELDKVIENIADPNTDTKKARKITVNITLKPNKSRTLVAVDAQVKATLAPANKVETNLLIDKDNKGKLVISEIGNELPGQISIDDVDDKKIINMK